MYVGKNLMGSSELRRCIAAQGGVLSLLPSARLFYDDGRVLDGEACEPRLAQLYQFENFDALRHLY